MYLSGFVCEVICCGDEVSYIELGVEFFMIELGNMVVLIIFMLNMDVVELSCYYDFVKVGCVCEVGVVC